MKIFLPISELGEMSIQIMILMLDLVLYGNVAHFYTFLQQDNSEKIGILIISASTNSKCFQYI